MHRAGRSENCASNMELNSSADASLRGSVKPTSRANMSELNIIEEKKKKLQKKKSLYVRFFEVDLPSFFLSAAEVRAILD